MPAPLLPCSLLPLLLHHGGGGHLQQGRGGGEQEGQRHPGDGAALRGGVVQGGWGNTMCVLQVVVQSERNVNSCYSLFRSRDVSEAEAR